MGYELHITRRDFHADEDGPAISADEWLALVEADDKLELMPENGPYFVRFLGETSHGYGMGRLDWANGCISTKNPDEQILAKMLHVAEALDAHVQGDDGEVYVAPDLVSGFIEPPEPEDEPGFFGSVVGYVRRTLSQPAAEEEIPFDVGDRVRDLFGNEGVVTSIDRTAEHGLGKIAVTYDDGRELSTAVVAHGLKKM